MTTNLNNTIDPKIIERLQKMLRLANDGGATEGEANNAMEIAERIMLENNLSMAMVEASNGKAAEDRLKHRIDKGARYRWQRKLMWAIAQSCFCYLTELSIQKPNRFGMQDITIGYNLIGRVSNVETAKQMYEYLIHTITRLKRDYSSDRKSQELFVAGISDRLRSRVIQRHRDQIAAQKAEAEKQRREQETRSRHPASAPATGNALVVVLEDYERMERDFNEDFRQGWAPGTTMRKRQEASDRHHEAEILKAKLIAEGVDPEVAYDMAHLGWTREKAEEYEARVKAQAQSDTDKPSGRRYRYKRTREDRLNDWDYERSQSEQYRDGVRAGDSVSLNEQVGSKTTSTKQLEGESK